MTDRLPFDPARMAAAKKQQASDAPLSVSQLAGRIGSALASGFPASVRVIGEVSGFRERTHWYFDLKDAQAVVSCAMFASVARKLRFTPRNGQEVIVRGRVDFYSKQGRVSFIAERIEPVGAGALELAFRALCEELRGLGWFDQDRKRAIPACPRRVAVVTSRSAAALQDVLDTMRRRCPATIVQLIDVRVQGDGAAEEIAAAIGWIGRRGRELGTDAILVTRGGGSMEDLWAFNERSVAEAIVNSPIPVVAAIGHETDTTVAELVADLRCATPTQAAMRLTPDRAALLEQLDSLGSRLASALRTETDQAPQIQSMARHLRLAMQGRVQSIATRLERLSSRLESHRPTALHARRAEVLHRAEARLNAAIRARMVDSDIAPLADRLSRAWAVANERMATHLTALQRQLVAVGPMSVLRRGFSYTLLDDGRLLRSPSDAAPGDKLRTRLAEGEVRSTVDGAERPSPPPGLPPPAPRPSRSKPAKASPGPDQMDLFDRGR